MSLIEVYRSYKGLTNVRIREVLLPEIHSQGYKVRKAIFESGHLKTELDEQLSPYYLYLLTKGDLEYVVNFNTFSINRRNIVVAARLPLIKNYFQLIGIKRGRRGREFDLQNISRNSGHVHVPEDYVSFILSSNSVGPWETKENYALARHKGLTRLVAENLEVVGDTLLNVVFEEGKTAHFLI